MSDNTATEKTPPPQVWPTLRAADARGLIRFLVDTLGFRETVVYGEGDRVDHAELSWPEGGGVMLGTARESSLRAAEGMPGPVPGSFAAYVVTSSPDELFKRAREGGAEVMLEPCDTDYGSRDFAIRDPEGNQWHFGTYPGHSLPE